MSIHTVVESRYAPSTVESIMRRTYRFKKYDSTNPATRIMRSGAFMYCDTPEVGGAYRRPAYKLSTAA
jgi:hypothetical protein